MNQTIKLLSFALSCLLVAPTLATEKATLTPVHLRCEYRDNPLGIDTTRPRLSWRVEAEQRSQKQTGYRVLVASTGEKLAANQGDLWDSGKVLSDQTLFIEYAGVPLVSRQQCFWKVQVWNGENLEPQTSLPSFWSMGLLQESDWSADYISFLDKEPIHQDVENLYLPAARQYRKDFAAKKQVSRATIYSTALGIYELHLNGQRVGDAYFAPGWTDYRERAYYNTYDVTDMVHIGDNAIGAWVADGWYSGYVGFGLLTSMGTEQTGRATYGKTPALMTQLEIEYTDGTRETIGTDATWKVTGDGPIQEADLLMGEAYDASKETIGWSVAGFDDSQWQSAIFARDNGKTTATFFERQNPQTPNQGIRNVGTPTEFGFVRPELESFPGVPVRITEEVPAKSIAQREPGTFVFDLGQNFAGVIRLKIKGPAGHRVQIRYAEMLHPDGRMMTENLRKARATDFYTCKGASEGESYQPRFTFHGFQFVELSNFPGTPTLDTITGLVMHSDTPMTSEFACSDPMVNQLFKNVVWTQRANFLDLPTDCPQRDERMGWTGDAQAYVATAAYNADIGAFYTKWLRELMESQRPSGVFPGYAPFPFQHGWDFGTAWADAGVICPWTIWQVYGDKRVIETCWDPMTRFMQWRKRTSVNDLGISHGNAWGDWLAQGAETPLEYVDSIYYAISAKMMAEMAEAIGHDAEATAYREQFEKTKTAFQTKYLNDDGSINVKTQTAQALALFADLIPPSKRERTGRYLAKMLEDNGNHMATGFLGTRPLLPVLSASGQNDLATFLLQSREFPSWGYEIANGATTIWERWDSYTKEDAFGRHNAAMNSFSHYAFGAVCEWMFHTLAGIQSDGPGYQKIIIRPYPPTPGSNANADAIEWVKASYDSIRGMIRSEWKWSNDRFHLHVTIPANTTATIYVPSSNTAEITESGLTLTSHSQARLLRSEGQVAVIAVGSGEYEFESPYRTKLATIVLKTSIPKDMSINPDEIDVTTAKELMRWDFSKTSDRAKWKNLNHLDIEMRDGKAILIATGDDSQMSTSLDQELSGPLAIKLRAMPKNRVASQFFWSAPRSGFNAVQQNKRNLAASEVLNNYLFSIGGDGPVQAIRFDPFATYDQYANKGEMEVESISIYQLPEKKKVPANQATLPKEKRRPNVLFILSEDQGAQMGMLGTPGLQTPNLDAIAKSGTYFNNAFVAYPVCSASKAALYTGLYCHTNGILNNTHNFHKPANQVTPSERNQLLSRTNRVRDQFATLPEILKANGYYQGVTHKLHVLPNEKFPYDEFLHGGVAEIKDFLKHAKSRSEPWFLMVNIPNSHRPYPNSDKRPIRVNPADVELPAYLPDTAVVRQDWSEYLAGIEQVDAIVGETMSVLRTSNQLDETIVIYMSDHGPTFQHGKMTLYDLGLRVPLAITGPGIQSGIRTDALASEVDLLPTLLDLIGLETSLPDYRIDGVSLVNVLKGRNNVQPRDLVFAEISNLGPLPNDGIQERTVFDGRWKLIYRENVERAWRQVNADTRMFPTWGNRTYDETIRVKDRFPEPYRVLAEMDPQNLHGTVQSLELYDLLSDPDEMNNLAADPKHSSQLSELISELRRIVTDTNDISVSIESINHSLSSMEIR